MADHEVENGPELLTEREREIIQVLAGEIVREVREAGLLRDPEHEATEKRKQQLQQFIQNGREYYKAQVDFFKHMTTLSGTSSAFVIALAAIFFAGFSETQLSGIAVLPLGCLYLSVVPSLVGLSIAYEGLARFAWGDLPDADSHLEYEYGVRRLFWLRLASETFFFMGLLSFAVAVLMYDTT